MTSPSKTPVLIIVIGVSGSGKSTLAQGIAEHFNYTYLDADNFHSAENKAWMASGKALTDAMRIPWVNTLRATLRQYAANSQSCTLAFSGLRSEHRARLQMAEFRQATLFMKGNAEQILPRLQARVDHFMPPELLQSQFDALESPESEPGVFCIDISQSIEQCLAEACDIVRGLR